MKTATITFHSAENYGAFLQAYALQKFIITELGVDNEILNFVSKHMKEHYRILKKPTSVGIVIRNLVLLPFARKLNIRKKAFEQAKNDYLRTTEEFDDKNTYYSFIKKYDLCIAGSDQIWNLDSEDFSELFFLPGANRKISYAASAGIVLKDNWTKQFGYYLKEFEKVGVRENTVAKLFNDLDLPSGNVEICIDPTFLIEKQDYIELAGKNPIIKGSYIVYYSINNDPDSMKIAEKIGEKTGLPVYAIYSRMSSIFAFRYGLKTYYQAGPCEFLNLLYNAEYVLTNSFHGTALSIILQKKFIRLGKEKDGVIIRDDRIDSILEITGLQNRTLINSKNIEQLLEQTIEWEMVSECLSHEKQHAKNYLSKYILGDKK